MNRGIGARLRREGRGGDLNGVNQGGAGSWGRGEGLRREGEGRVGSGKEGGRSVGDVERTRGILVFVDSVLVLFVLLLYFTITIIKERGARCW